METRVVTVNPFNPEKAQLEECADALRNGGLVAFPTETVYGLGANALDADAVAKIFQAKGRPQDNPLIVHVARVEQLHFLVESVDSRASTLIERFWPGPLTLLFRKKDVIPDMVTAGLPLVAIRMPDHPVAHLLIDLAGVPIAAPSANLSGKPSPTRAQDVVLDLGGKIDFIVDGGDTDIGVESTVLDISGDMPKILRPGGIGREELEKVLGPLEVLGTDAVMKGPVPSPGMKYTHYAPKAHVYLVKGSPKEQKEQAILASLRVILADKKAMLLSSHENLPYYSFIEKAYPGRFFAVDMGSREDLAPVAAKLFSSLRYADALHVDYVVAETFPVKGLGLAIANRLERASGGREVTARGKRPFTVMMVCSGNTCRSPMAEAILRKLWADAGEPFPMRIISRGTAAVLGAPPSPEAVTVAKQRGLDLSKHSSFPVTEKDLEDADMVITMTKAHKGALLAHYPEHSHKIWTLSEIAPKEIPGDVEDPIGKGLPAYEETALQLEKGLFNLIRRFKPS